jgi:hypothetical protein
MSKRNAVFCILVVSLWAAGCIVPSDEKSAVIYSDPHDALTGHWITDCIISNGAPIKAEQVFRADSTGSSGLMVFESSAKNCDDFSRLKYVFSFGLTYSIGEPSASIAGAYDFEITYRAVRLKPRNDAGVEEFNSKGVCGIYSWEKSQYEDVAGKVCFNFNPMPTIGSTTSGSVQIANGEMRLGSRTELEPVAIYTKTP